MEGDGVRCDWDIVLKSVFLEDIPEIDGPPVLEMVQGNGCKACLAVEPIWLGLVS